ncbi:MAG TPA: extracellular solute-binding protein [Polyangiaceae bacterium]|nr:extracellular solute-binding protein [Polyangiaceae bacterium]
MTELRIVVRVALLFVLLAWAPRVHAVEAEGRIRLKYWEKWTGAEMTAMQSLVDDFNRSQARIFVDLVTVSAVNQKTLVAIAGGNPPDLAGVWAQDVVDFANKQALIPLDDLARGTSVDRARFLPLYWDMGVVARRLYGVISVPAITGLHWNKRLFREAGLDPERAPRTIAELDDYAKRLTRIENGRIVQMGFLHSEPVWWPFFWGYFYGGKLWDGKDKILLDSEENIRGFEWVQSYAKFYGVTALQNLSAGFGNFSSPQDPFMSGKLAMQLQGVWMSNYIDIYSPGLEWGAAPFPVLREGDPPVTFVDADMLIIPKGSPHPREAFEFIRFVSESANMEKLCLLQRKNSPLREVSDDFYRRHKNPYIRMFQALASSPRAAGMPAVPIWSEYRLEMQTQFQKIWLLESSPREALRDGNIRMQKALDRVRQRERAPASPALAYVPFALIALLVACVVALSLRERKQRIASGTRGSPLANVSLARGLAFFSPWGVGLLLFTAYPVMASAVYSLCDYSTLSTPRFIGLSNYLELFQDEVFFISLKNTLLYTFFSLPLGLISSFSIALLLDTNVRGSTLYRTLIFLPSLTPVVASAMVWLWIFNSQYGVLNDLLARFSFGWIKPVPWLADPRTALPSIILMSVWGIGQTVVVLLAAMQDVPTSIYEAAEIDGANALQKVLHITVPLTSPVIYFNAIIGIINALQVFAQPYIMTLGGPARATLSYSMRLYENAFTFLRMGYAAAMAWILFLIILGLTLLAVRVGKRRVHYVGV